MCSVYFKVRVEGSQFVQVKKPQETEGGRVPRVPEVKYKIQMQHFGFVPIVSQIELKRFQTFLCTQKIHRFELVTIRDVAMSIEFVRDDVYSGTSTTTFELCLVTLCDITH